MRKIIASLFISLDGVVESPEKWHLAYFNDEMGAMIGGAMGESDAMMMGRVNYQEWAAYWPSQSSDDPFAAHMNNVRKYVVSTTLEEAEWNNSSVINGDVQAEITALKEQPGKDIAISGSGTLVRSLLEEGLLDQLNLLVHPIVVGNGKRLFEEGTAMTRLKLVDSQTYSTGVVMLSYAPA